MEQVMFQLLEGMEASWWYRARANVVRSVLARDSPLRPERALDVGSGFGGMCGELARASESVYAWEPHKDAQEVLRRRDYAEVFNEEDEALAQSYDLVGMFDVLEHMADDRGFLTRLRGSLTPDARLVLTVPAFPFLWSVHDELNKHYRRYTKKSLRSVLTKSGYDIEFISHWNALFFLPAAFVRLFGRTGEDTLALPKGLNDMVLGMVRAETWLLRGAALPFGTSLVAVARAAPRSEDGEGSRCWRTKALRPSTQHSSKHWIRHAISHRYLSQMCLKLDPASLPGCGRPTGDEHLGRRAQ